MKFLKKHQNIFFLILFSLIISFITLMFTSKCSFLYPFNDWVDANAFFTMGKSLFNGLVPYKDLFEQKGILLYFIYGIGYLISNKTFLGIFILEVISLTITLYYIHKITNLYLKEKYSYLTIPLFAMLFCTSKAFVSGGSAEEFCLIPLVASLYYFLDFFKNDDISYKHLFLSGLYAGLIFLIKYTLLGFHFAFMALIFFNYILEKQYRKSILACFIFLLGMFLPIGISLIYFGINHALKDFFNVYFLINMTFYSEEVIGIFTRLWQIYSGFIKFCFSLGIREVILVMLLPIFLIKFNISKKGKISLIILYLFTILGLLWGLKFYKYYLLPMLIFSIISLIVILSIIDKYLKDTYFKYCFLLVLILSLLGNIYLANYKEMRSLKKQDFFQYTFLEEINKVANPTLVNMGFLDGGLYTTSGIVPTTYFFEKQNISYDRFQDNLDAFNEYIKMQKTDFILYLSKSSLEDIQEKETDLFNNYELIKEKDQEIDYKKFHVWLFKKINRE